MIDKKDIITLLTELKQREGINTDEDVLKVISSQNIPLDVLKKINESKPLDILSFYEKLRQSYNSKRSKLYMNIMKADENLIDNPKTALTTITALLNQILQYKAEDNTMFYRHSRCDEITKVLDIYFKTYNIDPVLKLLSLFKADIVTYEVLNGRRKTA